MVSPVSEPGRILLSTIPVRMLQSIYMPDIYGPLLSDMYFEISMRLADSQCIA